MTIDAFARRCFLHACRLDVAVRKPGNVSVASPGHGMQAAQFLASAQAAAAPLFAPGARVGERIEAAVAASVAAAGCNTNLGIVLLAAPIAAAAQCERARAGPAALRAAIEAVLGDLDVDDARAAYRAIALANPGGLGSAEREDVHAEPSVGLRAAMALAAGRDSIARQYHNGYAELFAILAAHRDFGFPLMADREGEAVDAATEALVQRIFLDWLSLVPDSHIVRKHGEAVAQTVMHAAQARRARAQALAAPGWAEWDDSLKAADINPGTSADLTVATLLVAALLAGPARAWHGS